MNDLASLYTARSVVLWRVKSDGETGIGETKTRQLLSEVGWSIDGGSWDSIGGKCEKVSAESEKEGKKVDVTEV